MAVELRNGQRRIKIDANALKRQAQLMLDAIGRPEAVLSILLTDDAEMARLHERWMGEPGPTDVMSFPVGETAGDEELFGDIVISVETAARRSRDVMAEVRRYLIHGVLHLNGHDHATKKEKERMDREAKRLREALRGKSA